MWQISTILILLSKPFTLPQLRRFLSLSENFPYRYLSFTFPFSFIQRSAPLAVCGALPMASIIASHHGSVASLCACTQLFVIVLYVLYCSLGRARWSDPRGMIDTPGLWSRFQKLRHRSEPEHGRTVPSSNLFSVVWTQHEHIEISFYDRNRNQLRRIQLHERWKTLL